ncbi:helix-turn-helix domain-containing protein [Enterococcus sp. LJL51]|uniref:helix-turn-helix domain-containing protein n=1 Tax=Enterococcus sp. LJL51 TaxID=3416656 RepID=UPI003CE8928E
MVFKDRLLELRIAHNLTQQELADKLNVVKQTVGSWERGRTEPSLESLNGLATVLHTTTDYLTGQSDFTEPDERSIEATTRLIFPDKNPIFTEIVQNLTLLNNSDLLHINALVKSYVEQK